MSSLGTRLKSLRHRLGPGLLFAAAAVGTSHVVQSTRAGAAYGLTLIALVLAVCLLKYPLFRFAAQYAAATGENLVAGYARRGRTLVLVMFVSSAIEAVAATAGVSLVTASIGRWLLGLDIGDVTGAVVLMLATGAIVLVGRYRLLESLTGVLVIGFSLLTLVATVMSLGNLGADGRPVAGAFPLDTTNWSFAIALSGWMPIGNTASIMLAGWVLAKAGDRLEPGAPGLVADTRFDFDLGYAASAALAVCFVIMGTSVMFGTGGEMPANSAEFVAAFVGLYGRIVGEWSTLLVSVAALAVMYSTLLAIVDGFPRLIAEFVGELGWLGGRAQFRRQYLGAMALVLASSAALLTLYLRSFAAFIDLVTFVGFLAAPIVALANQLALAGSNVPAHLRPSRALARLNVLAVVLLAAATAGYVYLRFAS